MDTKELAAHLADLEAMSPKSAFNVQLGKAFNDLLAELQPDGLEVVIDDNWRFLVRQRFILSEHEQP